MIENTLFLAWDWFESGDVKAEKLRKSQYADLSFGIDCIVVLMEHRTKLIIAVVEAFTSNSFKDQWVIVIFPYIVTILTFLILASIYDITAVFCEIEYSVQLSIRISSSVPSNPIWISLDLLLSINRLIIHHCAFKMIVGTKFRAMSFVRTRLSLEVF